MFFGILIGTYSSIFIAAPLLASLGVKRETVEGAAAPARPTPGSGQGVKPEARAPPGGMLMSGGEAHFPGQALHRGPTATARLSLCRHEPTSARSVLAVRRLRPVRQSSIGDLTAVRFFTRFRASPARVSFVLLGAGPGARASRARLCAEPSRRRGVGLDVMDTGAACRTYNVLLAEGRPVAAALIAVEQERTCTTRAATA